ncbi:MULTISPECIES: PP2C family protein-serine/threonine phosphatase [unclassified Streptomyces]|uniref:PP2C family protein-serine/threonine phosphatase n=1 Tax=unclassified Streptomyces TaxID=2593676 RepID=UPI000DB9A63B|nr:MULTISPECIES: PP2C family protein-serine/threonine phosphatase [unclassified Streptomyces]MYT68174.1 SpoIIE family protein phosphatase [Streptomyces sp. SID8367]RAJ72742.1 stage II sporulation protein E [Streptomyces sp. PsTaAH-137]
MVFTPADVRAGALGVVSASSAPYPVVLVDSDGYVLDANTAARDALASYHDGQPALPGWLVAASMPGAVSPASGPVGDRFFSAHPTAIDSGATAWWLLEETDHRHTAGELHAQRSNAEFLISASSALLASLNLERCMETTARLAAEHLADAAVVLAPGRSQRLPLVACDQYGQVSRSKVAQTPDTMPGLTEALQGFPPLPARWIDPSEVPEWIVPEGFGPVGSLAIAPLPGHGVAAGALVLLRHAEKPAFSEVDEELGRLFAARAGAAMSAARLYAEQDAVTQVLKRELLAPELVQVRGVEFAGGYRSSQDADQIGGDFYDVHPAADEDGETFALLGDVSGKGLEAAVLTGKIRNTLHALHTLSDDHQQVLGLLNDTLLSRRGPMRFATLVLASARREGSDVVLRLTSGGHPVPLIVRRDGRVEEAATSGSLIGALPRITSSTATVRLSPGESCVLYTDGVTEARGGRRGDAMFGEERLQRLLQGCAGMPAEAVVERIQMTVAQWIGKGKHDDIAVMAITAPRSHHLTAVDGTTPGRYTA